MQFLTVAFDYRDPTAPERRQLARPAHLKLGDEMIKRGELLYAAAILDDSSKMIGSMMVTEFSSRQELDKWLQIEPYVVEKVWEKIEVRPCRPGPSFANKSNLEMR